MKIFLSCNYRLLIRYCVLGLVIITNPLFTFSQNSSNQTMLVGYYGGSNIDSVYRNYMEVERVDTGLLFRRITIDNYYDLATSQNSTYCDDNGIPQLQWQGCYILDSKTLTPIENGDFDFGIGTKSGGGQFCQTIKYQHDPGPGALFGYDFNFGSFFINTGDINNILLVYYRYTNELNVSLRLARIDLKGTIDNKPLVVYKDSIIAENIKIRYGSVNAIKHGNGKNWFIAFSEQFSSNYYSILIDENGIHSPEKSIIQEQDSTKYFEGTSIFSPNGNFYSVYYDEEFFVLNFDRCEGKFKIFFHDTIPEDSGSLFIGFTEFSPNNRFLYVNNLTTIYQFDLEATDIPSSRTTIAQFDYTQYSGIPDHPSIPGVFDNPFRGKDNRLYYWAGNTSPKIHRIDRPNEKGPDVGFTQYYYTTPIGPPWYGPTLIDYDTPNLPEPCLLRSNKIDGIEINFMPNPTNGFLKAIFKDQHNYRIASIIDINGRVLWKDEARKLVDGINVEKYSGGIYHLLFDGKYVGRFVKI